MRGLPETLDVRGTLPERAVSVAIVGARAAFARDLEIAATLACHLASTDALVVSGGAIGIDSAAHRAALAAGGATVVVLGTGIDIVYPARNRALFAAAADRGAVISSLPRQSPPLPHHFVARNAVIAALADLVVVVGASATSGSLHTAAAARRLGRPVAAVPGAAGCERLLADGAAVVETPDDLSRCLAGDPRRLVPEPVIAGSVDDRVLAALSPRVPSDPEDVADRAGLALRDAQRALADLELRGLVRLAPGHTYLRSPAVTA